MEGVGVKVEWKIEHKPSYSLLKVYLEPRETITAEAGAMVMMRGDLEIKTHTGGIMRGFLRAIAGTEALFLNTYIARSRSELWFAPSLPGDIDFIKLQGDEWIVQDSSYLAHYGDVEVGVAWRGLKGVLAEGELVWLKLKGVGGVWINSYGSMDKIELEPGEKAVIDNFHFVAMPSTTKWKVRKFGGWKSFLLGGEGLVFEVTGPATIYVQTRILPPLAVALRKFIKRR